MNQQQKFWKIVKNKYHETKPITNAIEWWTFIESTLKSCFKPQYVDYIREHVVSMNELNPLIPVYGRIDGRVRMTAEMLYIERLRCT